MRIKELTKKPAGYEDTLPNLGAIADYVEAHSDYEVSDEDVVEFFRGNGYDYETPAHLKLVDIASLKEGNPDYNTPDKDKEEHYAKQNPEEMPPILVHQNDVVDGNHRYRVAKKLGLKKIWAYVIS